MVGQIETATGWRRESASELWRLIEHALVRQGDDVAVVSAGSPSKRATYRQLHRYADAVAEFLRNSMDIEAGDRVVLHLGNTIEYLAADLALMRLGAVKVPVNHMLADGEIRTIMDASGAAAVLLGPEIQLSAVDGLPAMRLSNDALSLRGYRLTRQPDLFPFENLGPAGGANAPAVMYFTGGTTGAPKGVVHPRSSVALNLLANAVDGEINAGEQVYLSTPLSHSAGLFAGAALLRGATIVLDSGFDPQRFVELVAQHQVSWTFMVPTMIYRLLDHLGAERPDWTLRTIVYGAAPIAPARLRQAVETLGPVMIQLFGQTECPNWGTVLTKDHHRRALQEPRLLESAGRAATMAAAGILGADGEIHSSGTGELCLSAPYVMAGYYGNEVGTSEVMVNGWLRTGDIGSIDTEGFVYLRDRRSDMIISGGMNVYTIEVETALFELEEVAAVAVIGVDDPDWGEAVHAVVVPSDTSILEGADTAAFESLLREHSRAQLAGYKRPKTYEFVENLPLTPFGKVDKKQLRSSRTRN